MRVMVLTATAALAVATMVGDGAAIDDGLDSKVLEGVPRVGYDTRFCTLAGSIEAVMQYLGDPTDYDYVMGVTGLAFRRLWNRDDGGNVGPLHFAPECVRKAFWALGYNHRTVSYESGREAMLLALKRSLASGRPVLASGIVGPPECEIVTGYSQGGAILHGWSYFQDDPKDKYYSRPDWFEKADWANNVGLIVIGSKRTRGVPSKRQVLTSSLQWAIELERRPTREGLADHSSGLAAYDAWAEALQVDADYPSANAEVMNTRHMVQTDQAVMVEERRHAAAFLRKMADAAPEAAKHLTAAADLYDQVGQEGGPVYPWGPNWAKPDLADPTVRHEIAKHVRAARNAEAKAVALLEEALAAMESESVH
jgi:hypothetical protein